MHSLVDPEYFHHLNLVLVGFHSDHLDFDPADLDYLRVDFLDQTDSVVLPGLLADPENHSADLVVLADPSETFVHLSDLPDSHSDNPGFVGLVLEIAVLVPAAVRFDFDPETADLADFRLAVLDFADRLDFAVGSVDLAGYSSDHYNHLDNLA